MPPLLKVHFSVSTCALAWTQRQNQQSCYCNLFLLCRVTSSGRMTASYLDLPANGIIGHKQVTDAYLVLLAQKHGGSLATMDQALAAIHEGTTLIEQHIG